MPRVSLTYRDKIDSKIQKMMMFCLGVKENKKISWNAIADEMTLPRSTVCYRFKNGLFTLPEWLEFWYILGINKDDIDFFL